MSNAPIEKATSYVKVAIDAYSGVPDEKAIAPLTFTLSVAEWRAVLAHRPEAIARRQREADLVLFAKWAGDVELPFGETLRSRHTFNVDYPEYVMGAPLVTP